MSVRPGARICRVALASLGPDLLLSAPPPSPAGLIMSRSPCFTGPMIADALTTAARPRQVVDAAGAWLAAALAADGFRWLHRDRLIQRQQHALRHHIALAPSVHNRAGQSILVRTYVGVADPALRQWRLDHPHLVAAATDRDFVCGHLLGYAAGRVNGYLYGDATDGDLDLTEPASRERALTALVAIVGEGVLPWFAEASDPDTIVTSRAADCTSDPVAIAEWLASRHRLDLVDDYGRRYRARHAAAGDRCHRGVVAARNGDPNPNNGDRVMSMGWSITTLTTC